MTHGEFVKRATELRTRLLGLIADGDALLDGAPCAKCRQQIDEVVSVLSLAYDATRAAIAFAKEDNPDADAS